MESTKESVGFVVSKLQSTSIIVTKRIEFVDYSVLHATLLLEGSKLIRNGLLVPSRTLKKKRRGNCYVTAESLFHLLGGKAAGYTPHTVRHEGSVHWYLRHETKSIDGIYFATIIDPTASQFKSQPPYHKGRARGFLTKGPSKRAREMMQKLVWQ